MSLQEEANKIMEREYQETQIGRFHKESFKFRLKRASEEGILLFAKYALLAVLIYASLQFFNGIVAGSQNGTQTALYLQELINKGYLPKAGPNGIEPKVETPVAKKD